VINGRKYAPSDLRARSAIAASASGAVGYLQIRPPAADAFAFAQGDADN
jgi:hypothetical protein